MIKPVNEILSSKMFANEFQKAMKTTQRKFKYINADEVVIESILSKKGRDKLADNLLDVFIVAYGNALRKLDPERYIKFLENTSASVAKKLGKTN